MANEQEERVRLHAIVEGVVQGVNFRYYTMRQAQQLGLTGWVANRRDGKVEMVAEGPKTDLETFLAFLNQGPPAASVRKVTCQWQEAMGEFSNFQVTFL